MKPLDILDVGMAVQEVVRRIKNPSSEVAKALSATYARFVDESGNPLSGRHVVIKVSSTTGEILDIVAEA